MSSWSAKSATRKPLTWRLSRANRTSGSFHPAHQQCARNTGETARYRRCALQSRSRHSHHYRAAADQKTLPLLPHSSLNLTHRAARGGIRRNRLYSGLATVSSGRLPGLSWHRLSRTSRHPSGHADFQRDARDHPRARRSPGARAASAAGRGENAARSGTCQSARRRDQSATSARRHRRSNMRPLSSAPEASDARFAWRGADAHGRLRRGVLVAAHAADVRAVLKRQRIVAIEIIRKGAARPGRVRSAEITLFSRQLANLLQAGIPLLSALNIMAASDASAALARVVQAIAGDIVQGLHCSAALARHRCFDALYCQLVAVGEASGSLAELLAQLANDRERSAAQKAKLRAALSYPAGVLLLALLITVALMIWVVPTFEQVFDGFGAALPSATARAIAPASLAMVALCLGCSFGLRRSSALRAAFDRLLLMPPIVG